MSDALQTTPLLDITIPPASPTVHLESALKNAVLSLSQLLAFHSSLQSLGVAQYATNAPRATVLALQSASKAFDTGCDSLEDKVLRALAIIERDQRKAQGLSPILPPPSPTSNPLPPIAPADDDALQTITSDALPGATIPDAAPEEVLILEDDIDDSFMNDSLFGDSTFPSPELSLSIPLPSTTSPAAPHLPSGTTPIPDLEALLAMVNNFPTPPNANLSGTPGGLLPMDLSLGEATGDSLAGINLDMDLDIGEIGKMGNEELEELLRSLGGGT